ncbi:hypothetical protein WICPIJ_003214 [Wickerhamomyces pijperi]|uniref:Uncharacterized protein n=1 Tax=Wickerhamomyces pijperi TaxID=599730 RepID=A0A9P8QA05_WICPI|nr:hypothetical protein WICPIJ_003214 [Wickerhamomyces pijperi]
MVNESPAHNSSTLAISPMIANRTRDVMGAGSPLQNQPLFPSPLAATPLKHQQPPQKSPSMFNGDATLGSPTTLNANSTTLNIGNGHTQSNLSAAEKLRLWRHDALMQHHYKTAEYIGDKVLSLTDDPNDAFWLAQVHYNNGNYYRARQLLSYKNLDTTSVSCRYLTVICLMKLDKWDEALDVVGETNPFKNENQNLKNLDGGIKLEASLCYLRGQIYSNQNNLEKAKDCYKEAVLVDVKCYEAFDELVRNDMLSPVEEWELLSQLDFSDVDENAELVKLLYTSRLNKYLNKDKFHEADVILREDYNLKDNTDVLLCQADLLYVQCKFQKCLELCEKILEKDELNFQTLPTYLACLHELGGKNKLFLLTHKLAEHYPKSPMTWLAIGIYYLSIGRIGESRKFFSKASMLDPNCGQSWIGFAHTFAAEGEHEQAIAAYSTASRFFPGTHLPNLFLGMQYLQMGNLTLAGEYLMSSYSICSVDPLLLNEIGVIYFHKGELTNAENYFKQALLASQNLESDSKAWISVHANLGHVYRRLNLYAKALSCFEKVLKLSNNDSNIYSAIGLIYLKWGYIGKAIENLHYALSINSNDPVASDLLRRALDENNDSSGNDFFQHTKDIFAANQATLDYKKQQHQQQQQQQRKNVNNTPLSSKIRNLSDNVLDMNNLDQRAKDLINGDDSSDEGDNILEDDDDAMELSD